MSWGQSVEDSLLVPFSDSCLRHTSARMEKCACSPSTERFVFWPACYEADPVCGCVIIRCFFLSLSSPFRFRGCTFKAGHMTAVVWVLWGSRKNAFRILYWVAGTFCVVKLHQFDASRQLTDLLSRVFFFINERNGRTYVYVTWVGLCTYKCFWRSD